MKTEEEPKTVFFNCDLVKLSYIKIISHKKSAIDESKETTSVEDEMFMQSPAV